jgi:hypothetical protein
MTSEGQPVDWRLPSQEDKSSSVDSWPTPDPARTREVAADGVLKEEEEEEARGALGPGAAVRWEVEEPKA